MFVWIILALCAVGTTSGVPPLRSLDDNAPEDLIALASEYIPYSEESEQLFKSTADLIKSFLDETPNDPELPAVIPSGSQFQIPSNHLGPSDISRPLFHHESTADLIKSFLDETPNDPELPAVIPSGSQFQIPSNHLGPSDISRPLFHHESTADLIKSFLDETPNDPELPAVIPSGSQFQIPSNHLGPSDISRPLFHHESTADLIKSFLDETPNDPELPAVIPSGSQFQIPSNHLGPSDISRPLFHHESTADLIKSFLDETPNDPELPAVIPSGSQFQIPSNDFEAPHAPTTEAPAITTAPPVPPRPVFKRSMHLRDDLSVPASDYTENFDIQYHAESNTARTAVGDNITINYQFPVGYGKIQYLKAKKPRMLNDEKLLCEKSPPFPVGPGDTSFPGLPNLEPFSFVGYNTEESRRVEHWQHVIIGKPGEDGAARGESLNYTHDFFVYRDGEDAVPLRYTVTTDSSVLGPATDEYTHRYTLLPAPTYPLTPDIDSLCDHVEGYSDDKRRRRAPQKTNESRGV